LGAGAVVGVGVVEAWVRVWLGRGVGVGAVV
jgi:hypothetical protein